MNKIYISSLLVVLMAGAQSTRAQDSDLDALMASVESAQPAEVESNNAAGKGQDADLYTKGKQAFDEGDYDLAEKIFEAMLAEDPYDTRPMRYMRRIAYKVAAKATRRQEAVRDVAISEIAKNWSPDFKDAVAYAHQPEEDVLTAEEVAAQRMTDRLKGMMIPTLDFRDANIKDVILFLTETCRRMDTSGNGINMILLGLSGSDAIDADDEGNNITISVRNMSLYDSLQAIVEMANLKFEVYPSMVMIMPFNYIRSVDLVEESFEVITEVGDELASMAGGGDTGGGMDDLFGESTAVAETTGPVDVQAYFSHVLWPERAEATYLPAFNKLIVKNTPDNIKKVKKVLDEMTDKKIRERSNQVQIEAKFVEFADGAYEELGFDWNVYGSGSLLGGLEMVNGSTYAPATALSSTSGTLSSGANPAPTGLYNSPETGFYKFVGANGGRPGEALFSAGQRSGSDVYEVVTSGILSTMGGIAPSMIFSNGDVDMKIKAMQQEGTADVLSAPKVTTQSGNEAVIRVVEVHRYPQDYDVETGQRTAPVVKPQDWEDFDLGVVLRVTPDVDPEKGTILLQLEPEIKKFKGFEDYQVAVNAYVLDEGAFGGSQAYGDGGYLNARMPFFETRAISTRVTVADGHTVAMGGLIDERTETYRDQVPFLGDIPYIGRLFRTEGSRTAKKNLVIYVTATQVDERGMTKADRELSRQASIE